MRILTRYLFTQTLIPLIGSLFAFLFLWIIYDMFDNFSDFIEAQAPASLVAQFYFQQIPRAIAVGLPVAMLLAALWTLIGLSRASELVAMQACGVGIFQIGTPLLVIAVLASGALAWLNWEWNPQAVRNREIIMNKFKSMREIAATKREQRNRLQKVHREALVYRSKDTRRVWFIHKADIESWSLFNVEIVQLNEEGNDVWKYYVEMMKWDGASWRLTQALKVEYDDRGDAIKKTPFDHLRDPSLKESFGQVTSTMRAADVLSVPELREHLKNNRDLGAARTAPFHTYYYYRLTIGLSCLATTLMALPFAITASRREVFTGFGKAVLMYFAFLTVVHLFLALGKGNRIPPLLAGSLPVILFVAAGSLLFAFKCNRVESISWDAFREWRHRRRLRAEGAAVRPWTGGQA